MHARGWRSIYCMPNPPAFKGSAPINLSDHLNQVLRWALGSVEILLSRHCPIWYGYGGRLKFLDRKPFTHLLLFLSFCTAPCLQSVFLLGSSSFLRSQTWQAYGSYPSSFPFSQRAYLK